VVQAKEERLEKDLFRMKETLAKSVSYNEFTLMMQRVRTHRLYHRVLAVLGHRPHCVWCGISGGDD
jgi:hypothetical protein